MNEDAGRFSGSWKTVAIISCVLSVSLIGALVTVVYVKGADALSTIALTLAVIAFIAQLVIFAIQTTHSGNQLREAQELNRTTLEVLGDTRSRIDTTYQMVSSHNEMLLRINSAKAQDQAEVEVRSSAHGVALVPAARPDIEGEQLRMPLNPNVKKALSWPDAESAREAVTLLESLSETSIRVFSLNLSWQLLGNQVDTGDLIDFSDVDIPLTEVGLVQKVELSGRSPAAQVTEYGLSIGRVIAADWPPPTELEPLRTRLLEVRESISPRAISGFHSLYAFGTARGE